MYEADARGLSCPEPVMMAGAAMKSHKGETIKVLVSEAHSCQNVVKYVKSQGKQVIVTEKNNEFELLIES